MVTILIGAFLGLVVGAVLYLKFKAELYLNSLPAMVALGAVFGLIAAMIMGVAIPLVPVDKVSEYSLKPLDGGVYIVRVRSNYVANTGVAGFDSAFLVDRSEVDYDSASPPRIEVYNCGHTGTLEFFTFTPMNISCYKITVPNKEAVRAVP